MVYIHRCLGSLEHSGEKDKIPLRPSFIPVRFLFASYDLTRAHSVYMHGALGLFERRGEDQKSRGLLIP
jgi:hypothetical protein